MKMKDIMKNRSTMDRNYGDIFVEDISVNDAGRKKRRGKKTEKAISEEEYTGSGSAYYDDEEEQERIRRKKNRGLVQMSYLMVALFLSMAAYLIYLNVELRDDLNSNPYNTKQAVYQEQIIRGNIYSEDGETLAVTEVAEDGTESRYYPYSNLFAHIVGYATNGKSGVESVNNYELTTSHASILDQIREEKLDTKVQGDSIVLTLNSRLQAACYQALGDNKGAIVVLEPDTGKILAMVSKPDFDPNTIEQDWDALINDETNSSLFNRAIQGQYPPGSTFKILTALEYIREHPDDYQNFSYNCDGRISKEDVTITCYEGEVHGYENLESSFVNSCNGAFAQIGMEIDNRSFKALCEDFMFNKDTPLDLPSSQSLFRLTENASYGEEMMTAIGQGETLVSPLEMALVSATVANGGTMMKPYYIDRIETYDQEVVKQYKPSKYKELMSAEEVEIISGFMEKVVTEGTARKLSGESYTAAGKTGSAEYGSKDGEHGTHSWFTGYLDVENPKLAISVIIEDGGAGSASAVPAAKQIFDTWWYELQYE